MALNAEVYAGIKALEELRKDLNHEILTKTQAIAQLQEEVETAQGKFDACDAELSSGIDRAGIQRKDDAYLVFHDGTKTVLFRTHAEATALAEAGLDPNDATAVVPVK